MKRFLLLARILRKCGKESGKKDEQADLKGDNTLIFLVIGALILPVAFFFLGRLLGPFAAISGGAEAAPFSGVEPFFATFFLIIAFVALLLSVMELIGSLFLTSDLSYMLSLPFSARQIVLARTLNALLSRLLLVTLTLIPFGVGFALEYPSALPAGYWIGLILGNFLVPAVSVAIAAMLAILIMTVFRIARNREAMAVIGGLLVFAAWIGYMFLNKSDVKLDTEAVRETVGQVVGALSGPAAAIPVIPFLAKLMAGEGLAVNLAAVLGITAAIIALYLLVSDALYLRSALNMQDASGKKRSMTREKWEKDCRARSVIRAYALKDLRCIFRNPAYLVNGWLMALAWPVLLLSVFLVQSGTPIPFPSEGEEGAELMLRLYMMAGSLAVALVASFSTVGLSCLASSVISREGKSFGFMKTIPVSYRIQVKGKRNAVLLIAGIGSVGYECLAGIVLILLGVVRAEWVLFCLLLTSALLVILVNALVEHDLKKPNLNWESESSVAKSNTMGTILWIIGFLFSLILFLALPMVLVAFFLENAMTVAIWIALGVLILAAGLAVLSEWKLNRNASKRLAALDA